MLVQPYNVLNQPNINVSWMKEKPAWIVYILALLGFRYFISVITFDTITPDITWTIVHLTHCVASFLILHWNKGSAFYTQRQDINKLTFWEQIDGERAYTPTKKFLTVIPVGLFLITWHANNLGFDWISVINWIGFLVVFVAKFPFLHRIRLFGINA